MTEVIYKYINKAVVPSAELLTNQMSISLRTKKKKKNTVFLLISANVTVIVKFTEIGSVEY